MGQWEHKNRQRAQLVAPCIWLGPASVAKDVSLLKDMDVGYVVMIRRTTRDFASKVIPAAIRIPKDADIPTELIDVETYQQLASRFAATSALLGDYMKKPDHTNALVCCENGNDVSAAVAVAYVMTKYETGMIAATQLVQHRRFCVAISDELHRLLDAYQDILHAHWDLSNTELGCDGLQSTADLQTGAAATNAGEASRQIKRTFERDDDDNDQDMNDDSDRFEGRSFAPFVDA